MSLPELTHLQFLILRLVAGGLSSGESLRAGLATAAQRKSGPAFYQLMARLEETKCVRGWYEQKVVDKQIIRQRFYKVTAAGAKAVAKSLDFYREG